MVGKFWSRYQKQSRFWTRSLVFIGQHDGNDGRGRVAGAANRLELYGFEFGALSTLAVDVHPLHAVGYCFARERAGAAINFLL